MSIYFFYIYPLSVYFCVYGHTRTHILCREWERRKGLKFILLYFINCVIYIIGYLIKEHINSWHLYIAWIFSSWDWGQERKAKKMDLEWRHAICLCQRKILYCDRWNFFFLTVFTSGIVKIQEHFILVQKE